jgi:curved DNA-binding protein
MAFVNYYELLQISPNAEHETIQRVFRLLAARYHPDNHQTGDTDKFVLLNQAYTALSSHATRTAYDLEFQARQMDPLSVFNSPEFLQGIDGESHRRMGILALLYNRRRTNPDKPGMSILEFESLMAMPREHLNFTIWYLKEKGWVVQQMDNSDFVVTVAGADQVEQNLPQHKLLYNLLKAAENGATSSDSQPRDGNG